MYGIEPAELDSLKGKRFLVVDDERVNIQFFKNFFEDLELALEVAYDGKEAVETVLRHPPDYFSAVLMDIRMPELDGTRATEMIRERSEWASLPIIAMTGNHLQRDYQYYLESGMVDLLPKPSSLGEIIRMLCKWSVADGVSSTVSDGYAPCKPTPSTTQKESDILPGVEVERRLKETGLTPAGYKRLLVAFLTSQQEAWSALQGALAANDIPAAGDQAHKLAGACGNIGAEALRQSFKQLQQRCETETAAEALAAISKDLDATLSALCGEIERYCSQ